MKIIISIILLLIFIIPASAQKINDVGPNYTDEKIQELLAVVKKGIECDVANETLKADLIYYKAINNVLNGSEPAILVKVEEKIEKNIVLFKAFIQGMIQGLLNTKKYTQEELKIILKESTRLSHTKVDIGKSTSYRDNVLEQHLVQTFKYLSKCRKWEKSIMGDMAPN